MSSQEKSMIRNSVQNTLTAYYDDIRKTGLLAEFKYLDNSPDFFWVPPGYPGPINHDSVKSVLNKNASLFRSVNSQFDSLHIFPLNSKLASYTARITSTMVDTSGKAVTYKLVETGILIKRKDGWKLLNGQTTLIN